MISFRYPGIILARIFGSSKIALWTPLIGAVSFSLMVLAAVGLHLIGVTIPELPAGQYTVRFGPAWRVFGYLLIAPIVETLVILAVYKLFYGASKRYAVPLTMIVFASFHAMKWWGWGLTSLVASIFLVIPFAGCASTRKGYAISALVHFFHNLYALTFALLAGSW